MVSPVLRSGVGRSADNEKGKKQCRRELGARPSCETASPGKKKETHVRVLCFRWLADCPVSHEAGKEDIDGGGGGGGGEEMGSWARREVRKTQGKKGIVVWLSFYSRNCNRRRLSLDVVALVYL